MHPSGIHHQELAVARALELRVVQGGVGSYPVVAFVRKGSPVIEHGVEAHVTSTEIPVRHHVASGVGDLAAVVSGADH